jgi:DNA-binding NarL/FixJ family response regulator
LADDHVPYLEGMRNLLRARGVQVVGVVRDGLGAVKLAHELHPDLVLMDVHMPGCDGIAAARRIRADLPDIKIVMMTIADDKETVLAALDAGAFGYLSKGLDVEPLLEMLSSILRGERVLSPNLAIRILAGAPQDEEEDAEADMPLADTLTPRQTEVVTLLAQDLTNLEIAQHLHITENTVKYHVRQILERLGLSDRYEVAHYVREHGLSVDEQ